MYQNPQKKEPSMAKERNNERSKRRKKIREVFKASNYDHQTMLTTFKKYYSWKEKQAMNIPLQQLNADDKQPLFSIALHCGTKNGRNQILDEYANPTAFRDHNDMKNKTTNNFQKILNGHSANRSSDNSRKITFVDFKTKRDQKSNFFSYPDVKNIQLTDKSQGKTTKTEPMANTTSFRRTSFPKQLINLKQMINKLPSVKYFQAKTQPSFKQTSYQFTNPSFFNNSYMSTTNQFNQVPLEDRETPLNERRRIFRKSKTQSIRGYIQQLNDVISYADELIHQQTQFQCRNQNVHQPFGKNVNFTNKAVSSQHANYRKYWPQYPRYSLSCKKKQEDEDVARFFTNFSYSDPKLNTQLQNIVNSIKKDLNHQEKQMNKQIAQSEKNSIDLRYKYKLTIQKDNYKRNVKSFLKCKKEYRIERRRQEVRANGITRMKKSVPMDKSVKVVQKQQIEE